LSIEKISIHLQTEIRMNIDDKALDLANGVTLKYVDRSTLSVYEIAQIMISLFST